MPNPKSVLILCTANRCRSQMAQGWVQHFAPKGVTAYSAGVRETFVHPLAIKVMAEEGVDISGQHSKLVDIYLGSPMDLVVTVCDSAQEKCPVLPGAKKTIHNPFPDPDAATGTDEEILAVFRDVRDQIKSWASTLFA